MLGMDDKRTRLQHCIVNYCGKMVYSADPWVAEWSTKRGI